MDPQSAILDARRFIVLNACGFNILDWLPHIGRLSSLHDIVLDNVMHLKYYIILCSANCPMLHGKALQDVFPKLSPKEGRHTDQATWTDPTYTDNIVTIQSPYTPRVDLF